MTGGTVYANTIYQSWDIANSSLAPNIDGEQNEEYIYYHGFVCPTTGVYKNLQVKINEITGAGGYKAQMNGVVYNSIGNITGQGANGFHVPYRALSSYDGVNSKFGHLTNVGVKSGAIIGISLKASDFNYEGKPEDGIGVYLVKNNVYWIGIRWKEVFFKCLA